MNELVRTYLAAVVDPEIQISDRLFSEAKADIFDNPAAIIDPNVYLFDEDFYLSRRLRCKPGLTPLRDFFECGASLGLSPHPILDPEFVALQLRSDTTTESVTSSGRNVLLEILGPARQLSPNQFFEVAAYKTSVDRARRGPLPELAPIAGDNIVFHYLQNWRKLQSADLLTISSFFDPEFYNLLTTRQGFELVDPISHYLSKMPSDRTDCNPRFDTPYYRKKWGVKSEDCLRHFITVGCKRANLPNPYADVELGFHHMTAPAEVIEQLLINYIRLQDRSP